MKMATRSVLLLSALLLVPSMGQASDHRIEQVTVYPDRAEVLRLVQLALAAGEDELRIGDLPLRVQPDSIRIAVRSGSDVVLGGMELRTVRGAERVDARARDLEARIRALELRIQGLDNRIEARELQLMLLRSLAGEDGSQSADDRLAALEQLGERAEEILAQRLVHQSERADQQRELERLQRELADLGQAQRDTRELRVPVAAERAGPVEIEIAYVVGDAGWESLYEWRLDTETARLQLVQQAQIRQNTGEDWADARIRVALGQPAAGGQLPQLFPWFIDIERPQAPAMRSAGMVADMVMAESAPMAELAGTQMAAVYEIPGRNRVAGDNAPRRFMLAQHDMDVALSARAVPRQHMRAWLYVEAEYAGEAWLPPGRVSLFQDGAVVGQTRFAGLAPGGSLSASFGVAERIEISRQLLRDTRGTEGVVRRLNRLEREYAFEVSNRYSRPLEILIIDQLPVARDERIQVELTAGSRAPDIRDFEEQAGLVAWRGEYAAGQTERFRFGYRAVFPREFEDLMGW
ncbi:MAG: mucoidy inhibitor MuiA family protein [Wenzhouxiangella sp.]